MPELLKYEQWFAFIFGEGCANHGKSNFQMVDGSVHAGFSFKHGHSFDDQQTQNLMIELGKKPDQLADSYYIFLLWQNKWVCQCAQQCPQKLFRIV